MRKFIITIASIFLILASLSGCVSDSPEKVSLEEYNKIENGMTYDQVKDIIGSDGTKSTETGESGTAYYTVIYTWEGNGSTGANALFTFQNSKLMNKAQAGLK